MAIREIDAIGDAIIATEKEIAGDPWGDEETDGLDASGDRSNETMGEGLEGQHEPDDNDEEEGEESESESEEEGEGEAEEEAEGETKPAAKANGEDKPAPKAEAEAIPARVPGHRLREQTQRAEAAEAKAAALEKQLGEVSTKHSSDVAALNARFDQMIARINQPAQTAPKPAEAAKPQRPDLLDNPDGFVDHLEKGFDTKLDPVLQEIRNMRFETSLGLAHARHGEAFTKAFEASQKLNPQNPEDLETGRRIFNARDPGEALVQWHKRSETLRRVGDDPDKFEKDIETRAREKLMNDPEFRKQILADLRADANAGDDGRPRTVTRLPRSLNGAAGRGASPVDPATIDDSDQGVAESAWR